MDIKKVRNEKFADFLAILGEQKLYAPQKVGESLRFAHVTDSSKVELAMANTTVPPKSIFFPQTETLYRYEMGNTEIQPPAVGEVGIVLGVRPCDARAQVIVDNLFSWDVDDPYYKERRDKATVVGLACNKPCVNCFCLSLGGDPASTEGMDLLMTELDDAYLLQPLTEKGEKLCQAAAAVAEPATAEDLAAAEGLHGQAREMITRKIETGGIPENLPALWENALWQETAASCLGCGICTYLCPTCHCFDIQDEVEGLEGRRCRMWDSCMFKEYTLHASGHNPRPTRRERTRNRINHKYSYFVDKFNVIACVGCGRCINHCPVNIDILEILAQVKEAL
ncbi:MAG: 4Fe-4S dicluster domain-containing protein [Bacillota bacterium]